MSESITVRGYVATDLRNSTARSGLAIASFRMCSTERRLDRASGAWTDGHTNWYTVSLFRQLATNASVSIRKGDRVVVSGRLRVRPWINDEGKTGTTVEIDADTAGHDLMWGTAHFRRTGADRPTESAGGPAGGEAGQPVACEAPDGVDGDTGEILDEIVSGESRPVRSDILSADGQRDADAGAVNASAADGNAQEEPGGDAEAAQADLASATAPF